MYESADCHSVIITVYDWDLEITVSAIHQKCVYYNIIYSKLKIILSYIFQVCLKSYCKAKIHTTQRTLDNIGRVVLNNKLHIYTAGCSYCGI